VVTQLAQDPSLGIEERELDARAHALPQRPCTSVVPFLLLPLLCPNPGPATMYQEGPQNFWSTTPMINSSQAPVVTMLFQGSSLLYPTSCPIHPSLESIRDQPLPDSCPSGRNGIMHPLAMTRSPATVCPPSLAQDCRLTSLPRQCFLRPLAPEPGYSCQLAGQKINE
jgi:hypothetical protein